LLGFFLGFFLCFFLLEELEEAAAVVAAVVVVEVVVVVAFDFSSSLTQIYAPLPTCSSILSPPYPSLLTISVHT
jgi:hypothetical protein